MHVTLYTNALVTYIYRVSDEKFALFPLDLKIWTNAVKHRELPLIRHYWKRVPLKRPTMHLTNISTQSAQPQSGEQGPSFISLHFS